MRGEVCGNGPTRAPMNRRVVTAQTTVLRTRHAGHVLRVIELHVERLVENGREILQRWIVALRVGMTDQAHRCRCGRELPAVAIGAGFVTRESRRRGIVGPFVTRGAGK